jgi:hypothetical protein
MFDSPTIHLKRNLPDTYSSLPFGGDAIQQISLFLLFKTLFNADERHQNYERHDPRRELQGFRHRINLLLPVREEPNTAFNFVGINVRSKQLEAASRRPFRWHHV